MLQSILYFNIQNVSRYRTTLMGIATLLVIFGHSAGNGVVMPGWLESLCGLASVGVDIFLFVSGLGLWYSLNNRDESGFWVGIKCWYLKRYKRILLPYLLIIGFQQFLQVRHGAPIDQALVDFSTISYWTNHRGTWFIAMLIPVYAITPIHYKICEKIGHPVLYTMVLVGIVVLVSAMDYDTGTEVGNQMLLNVKHVLYHFPSFLLGFMLAPYAKTKKKISNLWMICLPIVVALFMRILSWGYWPGFLFLPFIAFCCYFLRISGNVILKIFDFFGRISLESYLLNSVVGSWIIWYLPQLYYSPINQGCYLSYSIVCVVGTLIAFFVNRLCSRLQRINQI